MANKKMEIDSFAASMLRFVDMQTAAGRYVDGLKPPYKGVAATIIGVSYRDRAQSVLCVGWATTVAAAGMKHTTRLRTLLQHRPMYNKHC